MNTLSQKEGEQLKIAFELKAAVKNFRWIISNPFYAGYVTGKLVDRKLIKGRHPALVSLKTFLKANNLITNAVNTGVAKIPKKDELPLKEFAKEGVLTNKEIARRLSKTGLSLTASSLKYQR
jgi:hypothetical protein